MKITINSQTLKKVATVAYEYAEKKDTSKDCSNFQITIFGDKAFLQATDLNDSIEVRLDCIDIDGSGSFFVSASLLKKALAKVKKGDIAFESNGINTTIVTDRFSIEDNQDEKKDNLWTSSPFFTYKRKHYPLAIVDIKDDVLTLEPDPLLIASKDGDIYTKKQEKAMQKLQDIKRRIAVDSIDADSIVVQTKKIPLSYAVANNTNINMKKVL